MVHEPSSESLRDLGEEKVVERLLSLLPAGGDVVVGPGDDCAVVEGGGDEYTLLKTDCLVEGIHFEAGTEPELVGRKAMNRALSDIAAMGGWPSHALVTIATESDRRMSEVEGWYRGMIESANAGGCSIVGGETSSLPNTGAVLSIALTGRVEKESCVLRRGASPGDALFVTGRLGGSFASGRHLSFTPRSEAARWLVKNARPTAMMDLSDGLGSDLPRLSLASGCGFELDPDTLPRHEGCSVEQAISDGEDYELLLTLSPDLAAGVSNEWSESFPDLELTRIGVMTDAAAGSTTLGKGWEHYSSGGTPE